MELDEVFTALTEGNVPGGTVADFDVDGILSTLRQEDGVSVERFWEIVRMHDMTQQGA